MVGVMLLAHSLRTQDAYPPCASCSTHRSQIAVAGSAQLRVGWSAYAWTMVNHAVGDEVVCHWDIKSQEETQTQRVSNGEILSDRSQRPARDADAQGPSSEIWLMVEHIFLCRVFFPHPSAKSG